MNHQLDQIKTLRMQKASLVKMVAGLNDKLDQARWETGNKTKVLDKEMKEHLSTIRQNHEKQMAALKQEGVSGHQFLLLRLPRGVVFVGLIS